MLDDFTHGVLDEVTPGQAKGAGFSQILLDGQVFLCRTFRRAKRAIGALANIHRMLANAPGPSRRQCRPVSYYLS